MKRISLVLVFLLSIMFILVACAPTHQHSFSEDWVYDNLYHWHTPLCDDAQPDKQPHQFLNGVCAICGYNQGNPDDKGSGGSGSENPGTGSGGNNPGTGTGNQGTTPGTGNQGSGNTGNQGTGGQGSNTPGTGGNTPSTGGSGSENPGTGSGGNNPGTGNQGTTSGTGGNTPGTGSQGSETPGTGLSGSGSENPDTGNQGTETPGTGSGSGNQGSDTPGTGTGGNTPGTGTGNQGSGGSGSENPGTGTGGNTPGTGSGSGNQGTETPGTGSGSGNQGTETPGTGSGGSASENPGTGSGGSGSENPGTGSGNQGSGGSGNQGTETPGTGGQDDEKTPIPEGSGDIPAPDYFNQVPTNDSIAGTTDEDGNVIYRVRVNRYNGRKIGYPLPMIKVVNSKNEAEIVYNNVVPLWSGSNYNETELSMIDLHLPRGEYKVYPYNIPEGFEYEPYYIMDEEHPLLDLKLTCHPIENAELTKIEQGMVMPNITIKSVNKGQTTLSELLKTNQIVVFMFFNRGCIWCQRETADFIKIYKQNPGKITYVLFDNSDDEQATLQTVRSDAWYGELADDFYIVCDKYSDKLYDKLNAGGHVPRNVFIDNGGYVFLVTGGVAEERLNRILYLDAFIMPNKRS